MSIFRSPTAMPDLVTLGLIGWLAFNIDCDVTPVGASCVWKPEEATFGQLSECPVNSRDSIHVYETSASSGVLGCSSVCARDGRCLGFSTFSGDGGGGGGFCNLSDSAITSCSHLDNSEQSRYYFKKTGKSDCTASWEKVYETLGSKSVMGDKNDLVSYVINGAKVRVKFPTCFEEDFSMVAADTTWVAEDNVYAQTLTFWGGAWATIQVDTTGNVIVNMVTSDPITCNRHPKIAVSWFVKQPSPRCEVKTVSAARKNQRDQHDTTYSNPLLMTHTDGEVSDYSSLDLVKRAMQDGFAFQVVSQAGKEARSFPLDNFSFDADTFKATALWVGNSRLLTNTYLGMDILVFQQDNSQLSASVHFDIDVTDPVSDGFKLKLVTSHLWFGHYCWEKVFETDSKGNVVFGSVQELVKLITDFGSPVRVSYVCPSVSPTTYVHSNVRVTVYNGGTYVMARSEISVRETETDEKNDRAATSGGGFNWEQKDVTSAGNVFVLLVDRKTSQKLVDQDRSCTGQISWFVDTTRRKTTWKNDDGGGGDAAPEATFPGRSLYSALTLPVTEAGRFPTVGISEKDAGSNVVLELYGLQLLSYTNDPLDGGVYHAGSYRDLQEGHFRLVTFTSNHDYGIETRADSTSGQLQTQVPHQTKAAIIKWFV